jgi:hypothetical protein
MSGVVLSVFFGTARIYFLPFRSEAVDSREDP